MKQQIKRKPRKKPRKTEAILVEEYAEQGWEVVGNIKGIQNPDKLYTVFRRRRKNQEIEWHCTCSAPESVWCYHKQEAVKIRRKKNTKPETNIVY